MLIGTMPTPRNLGAVVGWWDAHRNQWGCHCGEKQVDVVLWITLFVASSLSGLAAFQLVQDFWSHD